MARRKGWLKRRFKLKLKKDAIYSIAYIFLFCLAFLVILSFTRQGLVLYKLNIALLDFFGWGVVFLVFFLLLSGLMLTKFEVPWNQASVLAGGGLMAVSLMSLTKAGLIGEGIFEQIAYLITPIGTALVLIASTLIGFIVFFNTSFDQIVLFLLDFFRSLKSPLPLAKGDKKQPQFIQDKSGLKPLPKTDLVIKEPSKVAVSPINEPEELSAPAINIPGAQAEVWNFPPLSLLNDNPGGKADRGDVKANAGIIERTFDSFGISARVVEVNGGPAVTQYAIEVALGTKLSKITALTNDLALALAAPGGQIRVEAPIPGRSLVGIELPNRAPETVTLRQVLTSEGMKDRKSKLLVPLGLDVSGKPKVSNIAKMPHVLIAGQTGSGKSVLLNSWITTFLFRASPSEVKMILVDPKRVEFTQYAGVPHLLTPVIVEPDKVVSALKWATKQMDERYKLFAQVGARNIESYNEMSGFQALPYIVIVIDELADIILFAPAEVEDNICRLAQMARATGIHLVIATQRPSVDVLTGLIKANIPTRLSFAVASMTDSRVILDGPGAEKLLGRGDMLFIPPDQAKPSRIQGAYVSDDEVQKLIGFLNQTGVRPVYTEEVTEMAVKGSGRDSGGGGGGNDKDPLFAEAVQVVCQYGRASASLLQRRFSIGYTRAARIIDQLEAAGVIGPGEGAKPRDILVKNAEEFLASFPS
jgi:S-DNA-T family DNA segregation ATPase FtsK/SpoIIIE